MYAIIVITNSYASYLSYDELAENLRPLLPRPIISVSAPLNLTGNKYTRVSSNQSYTEIVDYLVHKYNRRRIGFFFGAVLSRRSREDLPVDAILCANDNTAAGVLTAFEQIGVKVPDDVAIFGFDNSQVSLACFPTISTIDQYASETGFKAAQMAYDLLDGKEVPD